jgi:rubrerythrin
LVYAVKMELDGEKYYREQAGLNRGTSLYPVFITLAEDECSHAQILEDKSKSLGYGMNTRAGSSAKSVFAGLADFKLEMKSRPDQADVYRMALEKEKQSIELYKKLMEESADGKDLYAFLIAQEEEHYGILEELLKAANRPNEWVESASSATWSRID